MIPRHVPTAEINMINQHDTNKGVHYYFCSTFFVFELNSPPVGPVPLAAQTVGIYAGHNGNMLCRMAFQPKGLNAANAVPQGMWRRS